ncbi:MAG: hypothetical protein MJY49_05800 [Bacteroidales bacterium]|nr:hypothetical protein [Bacteroidales bacterium]
MHKYRLAIFLFLANILYLLPNLSYAESRTVRPSELDKFNTYKFDIIPNLLIGEQVKLDFSDCYKELLSLNFQYIQKDTTWLKKPSNPKKAKLYKHYILKDKPIDPNELENHTFLVESISERSTGTYQVSRYKDLHLKDINNPNNSLIWSIQTSCNYQSISNPQVRVHIDKYQKIVTDKYVDNKDYYIYDEVNSTPNKDNGYTKYVPVKCTGCEWYLGGKYLSPIYVSTYESPEGNKYTLNEYRLTSDKLPIYKYDYQRIVNNSIALLKEKGEYFYSLSKVVKPRISSVRYGKTTEIKAEDFLSKYLYEDNLISILWFVFDDRCQFSLKNKSGNTIKVVWDDATFIDENNSASKIYHSGIRLIDANKSQPSTSIPNGTELEDLVAPVSRLIYSNGWDSLSLIKHKNKYDEDLVGKTIRVVLPIEVKGVINEYEFWFTINWHYSHPEYQQHAI